MGEREREEEETSQHPPFLFSFEEKRGKRERERWEDRRQEAKGKKHSCALLPRGVSDTSRAPVVSYSRPGIEQVSRRRRKPRMAGRKSGGGKDVGGEKWDKKLFRESSSGKTENFPLPLLLLFTPRVDVAGFSERRRDVLQPGWISGRQVFVSGGGVGYCAWPRIRHAYQFRRFFQQTSTICGREKSWRMERRDDRI